MRRRYKNPPIQEAVCEVHFDLLAPFSLEQIQAVAEGWKQGYPNQQRIEEKNMQFRFELGTVSARESRTGDRLVARSMDGTRLVQLSSQFIAVNQLKPYPGWIEAFRADILARVEETIGILKADKLRSITLRYIDRLDFPQRPLAWEEWLTIRLPVPAGIPTTGGVFQSHYQQDLDPPLKGFFVIATLPEERQDLTSIMLDNMIFWQGAAPISELPSLLDRIHAPLPTLFDKLLTEKTQELLGGYETV